MSNVSSNGRLALVVAAPGIVDRTAASQVISALGFAPSFADSARKAGWAHLGDTVCVAILVPPLNDVFAALWATRALFPEATFAVLLGGPRARDLRPRVLWSGAKGVDEITQLVEAVVALWLGDTPALQEPADEWDAPTLDAAAPLLATEPGG